MFGIQVRNQNYMKQETKNKIEKLHNILQNMKNVIVAYSGGVDSTFLLKVAFDVLGNKAKGVLAVSPTYPSREYQSALKIANDIGVTVEVIETNETDNQHFIENPTNRCYFCKSELFAKIAELSTTEKFKNMVDGSNFDDLGDHRPGMKALKEKNIKSPLQEAGLTKNEIRELSKELGLPTWNKDALACLSSRFPYGEKISIEKLGMVDKIENFIYTLGFNNIRARHNGNTLKIEITPDQIKILMDDDIRNKIVDKAKSLGYKYVTLDLEGYRQGSMNEILSKKDKIETNKFSVIRN